MRPRTFRGRTKDIENKNNHPINPADIKSSSLKLPTIHADDSASLEQPVNLKRIANSGSARRPNVGRHAVKCRVCPHPQREEIEADYIDWRSPAKIAKDYQLGNRSTIYRHMRALRLEGRRRRNKGAVLERILERVDDVEVTASAIVAAVQAAAKIDARGRWIERKEMVNMDELFEQMSSTELKAFAENGTLPLWFQDAIAAAGGKVPEGDDHE